MNAAEFLFTGWTASPAVLLPLGGATAAYAVVVGRRGRWPYFAAAVVLVAIALLSPLNALASGVLFSAHMAQHILLLLLVPALFLLSLPIDSCRAPVLQKPIGEMSRQRLQDRRPTTTRYAIAGWVLGVGSMWFWHVPQLCDAAAGNAGIHAVQTVSLFAMGTAFWWPILAPTPRARLAPPYAVAYLFTACLACTALGIVITLTPVDVCPLFRAPLSPLAQYADARRYLTTTQDQQIGGLLMWLPMCLVYLSAIILELGHWLAAPESRPAVSNEL